MPTLDLNEVFQKFGPVDKRLSVALVHKAEAPAKPGWLLDCFTDDACTVSLIFRALLAVECKRNAELSAALDKLLGNGMNIQEYLSKVFQRKNKSRANREQTITDFAISNLVNAFYCPEKVLCELETKKVKVEKKGGLGTTGSLPQKTSTG
jgi:hypothetical protein